MNTDTVRRTDDATLRAATSPPGMSCVSRPDVGDGAPDSDGASGSGSLSLGAGRSTAGEAAAFGEAFGDLAGALRGRSR